MNIYYAKRAIEIFRKEGFIEFLRKLVKFVVGGILKPLDPQYQYRFRFLTLKNDLQNRIRYDAPPEPYKTIEMRPTQIDSWVGRKKTLNGGKRPLKKVQNGGIARTIGGDWDRPPHRLNIEANSKIKGVTQYFTQDIEWEETELYSYYVNKGYDLDQIEGWCENIESLFENITENGYKKGHKGSHHRGDPQPVRDQLEVLVTIDRKGEICFFEGNHRFAIARILDIKIPLQVVCRHKQWQKIRDDIYNNGVSEVSEELSGHPDIQDIIH